jgi:ribosome-associated toxin RatA of RatAB toxin-antitoxin module
MLGWLLVATALGSSIDTLVEELGLDTDVCRELEQTGRAYRYRRGGVEGENSEGTHEAGVSLRVVNGAPDAIWDQVEDCDAFVTYLPYVTGSTRSAYETTEDGATWNCAMELTTKGFVTRYTVKTTLERSPSIGRFEMVEGSGSVLRSAQGYWQTAPWPEDEGQTLLIYVFESRAAWWVPRFAKRMAADRGLSEITHLVGRQVEKKAARSTP